jgi:cell volume regulation protein A
MTELMIISGLVIIMCITSSKVLYKFGVPMLLIFIALGMLFGSDGIVGIYFDNYQLASQFCTVALIFIMFYGGFGTNWKLAQPVALPSVCMSTLGVAITAGLTGIFCHFALGTSLLEGLLIGSVVASTDAASVFAVLRAQKLNLKGSLASLLEVESGSNDPMSYMLTFIILSLMKNPGDLNFFSILILIIKQIALGALVGALLARITVIIIKKSNFEIEGFYPIFVTAIAIISYAFSEQIGGNGYLAVYISGIIIGNSKIPRKKNMFEFFDGISWIMQIGLFFLMGLVSFPSKFQYVASVATIISLFMILIARPIATFVILTPFKFSIKENLFISWVGLRGAASVVFAIFAMTYGVTLENDIFHIIFFIALFSVAIQGTLIPKVANILGLVADDEEDSVLRTFTDYSDEINTDLLELRITEDSKWANKMIMEANIPEHVLIVMIKRGNDVVIPKGSTKILVGDKLILSGKDIANVINL